MHSKWVTLVRKLCLICETVDTCIYNVMHCIYTSCIMDEAELGCPCSSLHLLDQV